MNKSLDVSYLDKLKERKKESRVYTVYQAVGLILAAILEDEKHKSLYMKLAKNYKPSDLIALAKDISQRKKIKKRGAYFMKVIQNLPKQKNGRKNNRFH